jgi:hypothetical protein
MVIMKSYAASALIEARPEAVWAILTDAPAYPEWDSGVERVEGEIAPDQTIKVFSKISPGRAFPVKVRELVPGQRMVWAGGMPLGLFKGERTFTLSPEGGDATRFSMREEFSGPLLPLIWKSMPDLGPTFEQFAVDLKKRAEQTRS